MVGVKVSPLILIGVGLMLSLPVQSQELTRTTFHNTTHHNIVLGGGVPLCGFADGVITGQGCIRHIPDFFWTNGAIYYLHRFNKRIALGGGLLVSYLQVEGESGVGGQLLGDFRFYVMPDWLYLKLNVIIGIPLLFAFAPTVGHSFVISENVHVFLENQFIMMFIAGSYGFWQPTLGVAFPF